MTTTDQPPPARYCPYCGGKSLKHVGGVPRCTDCRAVFFLSFSRIARRHAKGALRPNLLASTNW